MMLKEKETDMDFWKKLKAGARPDSKTFDFTFSAFSILIYVKHHLILISLLKQSFGNSFSFLFLFEAEREEGEGGCIK